MEREEVIDILFAVRNRCEIAMLLPPDKESYLHTLVEDIYEDMQEALDYVVIRDGHEVS